MIYQRFFFIWLKPTFIDHISSHLYDHFSWSNQLLMYKVQYSFFFLYSLKVKWVTNAITFWLYIFSVIQSILHLSHTVSHCRDATGNKTCSERRSPNTPKINWTVYTICLRFHIKWLLCWQFYFLKMAGDIKPKTESLYGMIKFSVVKIALPWSQQSATVNGHIFRGVGSESIFAIHFLYRPYLPKMTCYGLVSQTGLRLSQD